MKHENRAWPRFQNEESLKMEPDAFFHVHFTQNLDFFCYSLTHRKLGLATRLMSAAQNAMESVFGAEYVSLHGGRSNLAAFNLYTSTLGYKIHDMEGKYYADEEDAHDMRKQLNGRLIMQASRPHHHHHLRHHGGGCYSGGVKAAVGTSGTSRGCLYELEGVSSKFATTPVKDIFQVRSASPPSSCPPHRTPWSPSSAPSSYYR